jgi:UDP-2,3-diacylglucosamine pyrophosphatase LpxH
VALPRYENELHGQFLAWCRQQKRRRLIGFMEGNREFFLAANHADAFSWCSSGPWHRDCAGLLFCHGDQINQKDFRYLTWRKLSKNRIVRVLLTGLPWGPALSENLKRRLKYTNAAFRRRLPVGQFEAFVEARRREGVQTVFAGHFHQAYAYRKPDEVQLFVLPAWLSTGCVSRYNTHERTLVSFVPAV